MDVQNQLEVLKELQNKVARMEAQNATSFSYSPGYTFPGNLPQDLYYAPTPGTPALSEVFTIMQGIRTDQYLILVNYLDKILQATTGCSPSYTTAGTLSDRKITVGKFSANLQWCKSDFISTASVLSNSPEFVKDGLDGYQASAAVMKMWAQTMVDAMRRDIVRIAFLGNTASGNANYNVIDGLLVKLFSGGASYCVKQVGNDFANNHNANLAADEALAAFQKVYRNSQIPLMQLDPSEKIFWVTGAVWANLVESFQSSTRSGSELQFRYLTDSYSGNFHAPNSEGKTQTSGSILTYNGIEVRPLWFIDNYLSTDSTNPWYDNMRNFIIYTPRGSSKYSNLVLGTEKASDLDRVDMFYDQRLLTTFAQAEVRFGVQFINCDLTSFYN
jgi:hypothetical protein